MVIQFVCVGECWCLKSAVVDYGASKKEVTMMWMRMINE
jgi:hypothetical protein